MILCGKCGEKMEGLRCSHCRRERVLFSLQRLQSQVREWTEHNFPDAPSHHPLLGIGEELGELYHAHLKNEQGIRTEEDHQVAKIDAIGDLVIYLADYCNREGIDLQEAITKTWEEVRKRDWKKDQKNGTNKTEN